VLNDLGRDRDQRAEVAQIDRLIRGNAHACGHGLDVRLSVILDARRPAIDHLAYRVDAVLANPRHPVLAAIGKHHLGQRAYTIFRCVEPGEPLLDSWVRRARAPDRWVPWAGATAESKAEAMWDKKVAKTS